MTIEPLTHTHIFTGPGLSPTLLVTKINRSIRNLWNFLKPSQTNNRNWNYEGNGLGFFDRPFFAIAVFWCDFYCEIKNEEIDLWKRSTQLSLWLAAWRPYPSQALLPVQLITDQSQTKHNDQQRHWRTQIEPWPPSFNIGANVLAASALKAPTFRVARKQAQSTVLLLNPTIGGK